MPRPTLPRKLSRSRFSSSVAESLRGSRPQARFAVWVCYTRLGAAAPQARSVDQSLNVHITEFTDPAEPKQKRLDKWLFTMADHPWFCIAGIWRESPTGEAFTMLTMDAGPDVAPYHHRQIIPLTRIQWADWLDPSVPASQVLRWLPQGSLHVTQVHGTPPAQGALML